MTNRVSMNRNSDSNLGLSALIFQHNDLICPTDTRPARLRIPPLHRVANYWDIAVESGRCGSREQVNFDMKSVFQRSFDDLILKDNLELPGFMLFLTEKGKGHLLDHLLSAARTFDLDNDRNGQHSRQPSPAGTPLTAATEGSGQQNEYEDLATKLKRNKLWSHLETKFYPDYLTSRYHYRFQRQVLREKDYSLKDFFYCEHALRHLREFLEQEDMTSLLSFWLAGDNFRQCVVNRTFDSSDEIKLDAMAIYQKYIGLGSPYYLGLDEALRASIECSISPKPEDDPQINASCFNQAMWIAYAAMNQVFRKNFPTSIMYASFVDELTTLASISDNGEKDASEGRKSKVMSIGTLDSLGRYVRSDNDIEIDAMSGAVLKPESEQERLQAMQFAKNFVNDVIYRNTSCVAKIETGAA